MPGKQESRAESLLPEVLPDIIALLNDAPDFGQCGVEIVFHDGRITRVITRKEAARQTCKKAGAQEGR
jgi:hypothetical protein